MALPNPGQDAVPFTTLTAQFYDDTIENVESLAAGTGLNDGVITNAKLSTASGNLAAVWTAWTPTITGLTSPAATNYFRYKLVGKLCFIMYSCGGTSTSGNLTFTLPFATKNVNNLSIETMSGLSIDNGSVQSSPSRVYVDNTVNDSVLNFVRTAGTGTWTGSGTKTVRGQLFYEVA